MTDPVPIRRGSPDRRVPPQDLEAEESLLGAMLLSRDAAATGLEMVTAADYYKGGHGLIHDAIRRLHTRTDPIDPVTVADELRRTNHLDDVGGPGALIGLQAATPATSNAGRYARIILDLALCRRMIAAGADISELGYSIPENVTDAVTRAETLIYNLGRPGATSTRQLDTVIAAVLERLADRAEKGETIDGIPTGWAGLDDLLLGLPPGDITILGARPAAGKSQFAVVLAWQVALTGRPVLFASLEMKAEEIAKRWLGTVAQVRLQHIRSATLDGAEWGRLNTSIASFVGVPIHVLDDYGAGVSGIAAAGRRIGMEGGLVIIDYAQLVTPHSRQGANRNDQVADVSRAIKVLAGDLGCHVLLLSQLSRQLESRGDKRPVLNDLRDSGALEQDASNVLFLYRDELYNPHSPDRGILEVICGKARNGPTGTVKLAYQPAWGRIRDLNEMEAAHHGGKP